MRRWLSAAAVLAAAGGPATAADLDLQRVVLSSGGVGYFEYAAAVDGNATLSLAVPLDQVDDILKSLVVYDPDGTVGELTLPGRDPIEHGFTDLPFDRDALDSVPALLNALQGAELQVGGAKPMTGRLLRVVADTARGRDGLAITRNRVSLLTVDGIRQFILEDADSIAFTDPELQRQLSAALTRVAAYRAKGLRRLTLQSRGGGKRTVRVGYVVGVPLWKASYRLSLAAASPDQARLQGWAVLENFSGHAWRGVELTLLSGNPVTFRQALYESYYVQRPSVPVEVAGRELPSADTGTVAVGRMRGFAMKAMPPAGAPAATAMAEAAAPSPPPPPARIEAAAAAENATETSFTLPYKVDVAAGQSLVVPILDRTVPAAQIDLYQPETDPRHPLAAVALTNDAKTGLPAGVLTLYEAPPPQAQQGAAGAMYLGDAQLAVFPPGEKRMLSYAVDTKMTVDRSTEQQETTVNATIAGGVLRLTRRLRQTTTYRIRTTGAEARRLVIEQAREPGWTLVAPDPATVELTARAYRIPAGVGANKQSVVAVRLEQPVEETVQLLDIGDDRLGAFVAATELSPAVRKALGGLAERRQALAQRAAAVERLKQQRRQLVEDERRLRANLAAVDHDTALYKETLDQLAKSEARIGALSAAIGNGDAELDAMKEDLRGFVSQLTL